MNKPEPLKNKTCVASGIASYLMHQIGEGKDSKKFCNEKFHHTKDVASAIGWLIEKVNKSNFNIGIRTAIVREIGEAFPDVCKEEGGSNGRN